MKIKFELAYLLFSLLLLAVLVWSWLPGNFIIGGHDSGLALNAGGFLNSRMHSWSSNLGFGQDNSKFFGSLTIHSIDYITTMLSGGSAAGNKVNVFFWLAFIFTSGFVLALELRRYLHKNIVYLLPIFVTFNFYVFQSVFILERAKFGLVGATMIFLFFVLRILDKKTSVIVASLISSLLFFVFNGGSWLGLPLYGSLFLLGAMIIGVLAISSFINKDWQDIKRVLLFFFLTSLFSLLLNSYSFLPYIVNFLKTDYLLLSDVNLISGNREWLNYISERSSVINLFRLQGVPDWYNEKNVPAPLHPYALTYTKNYALILLSFIFPAVAFLSPFLAYGRKQRWAISVIGLITLAGLVFSIGTQGPFGYFYGILYDRIPGFAIFRSPYYKFGALYVISISILLAFSFSKLVDKLFERIKNNPPNFTKPALYCLIVLVWFAYHYVLLQPSKIFAWRGSMSTRFEQPAYLHDYIAWAKKQDSQNRILLLPPLNPLWSNDAYDWGYWSLSPLHSLLSDQSIVTNDSTLTSEERGWVNDLYKAIEDKNEELVYMFSNRLGVNLILYRDDVLKSPNWSGIGLDTKYKDGLKVLGKLQKVETLGPWTIYSLGQPPSKLDTITSVVQVPDKQSGRVRSFVTSKHAIYSSEEKVPEEMISGKIYTTKCNSCLLETSESWLQLPETYILPNSIFYRWKLFREASVLKKAKDDKEKASAYLGHILRRTSEVRNSFDKKLADKYSINNMDTMTSYVDEVLKLLPTVSNPTRDFYFAEQISQIANSIDHYLLPYITEDNAYSRNEDVKRSLLDLIWESSKLKEFYSPILGSRSNWETEKLYEPNIFEPVDFLYINKSTLPKDLNGQPIFPSAVSLKDDTQIDLVTDGEENGWIRFPVTFLPISKTTQISVLFSNPPNYFANEKRFVETFPNGKKACISGSIHDFNPEATYQMEISVNNEKQALRLYLVETDQVKARSTNSFINQKSEFKVESTLDKPFVFYLRPQGGESPERIIYVCSTNENPPAVEKIILKPVFMPEIIMVKKIREEIQSIMTTNVIYKKLSQTKYEAEIKDQKITPYILGFNERYDRNWVITDEKGIEMTNYPHILVDGYANGWLISDNTTKFQIVHLPQKFFVWGLRASAGAFILVLLWLLKIKLKK